MKRMLIVLCFCMLASGCAPRTVIEDADPTEPEIMLTLAEEPEPIAYQVCIQITPAVQAKTYRDIPLSHELQDIADKACEDYKIPQDVLYAVMKVESGYKVDAQNGSCYGLMQIHTINMEYLSSNIGTTDLTDPEQNIQAGAFIQSTLLSMVKTIWRTLQRQQSGTTASSDAICWRILLT